MERHTGFYRFLPVSSLVGAHSKEHNLLQQVQWERRGQVGEWAGVQVVLLTSDTGLGQEPVHSVSFFYKA